MTSFAEQFPSLKDKLQITTEMHEPSLCFPVEHNGDFGFLEECCFSARDVCEHCVDKQRLQKEIDAEHDHILTLNMNAESKAHCLTTLAMVKYRLGLLEEERKEEKQDANF